MSQINILPITMKELARNLQIFANSKGINIPRKEYTGLAIRNGKLYATTEFGSMKNSVAIASGATEALIKLHDALMTPPNTEAKIGLRDDLGSNPTDKQLSKRQKRLIQYQKSQNK